jgi:hypothetical protein
MESIGMILPGPESPRRRNLPWSQAKNLEFRTIYAEKMNEKMVFTRWQDLLWIPRGHIKVHVASHPANVQQALRPLQTGLSVSDNIIYLTNMADTVSI